MARNDSPIGPLLSAVEVRQRLHISPRGLRQLVANGDLPPPIVINERVMLYPERDLEAFLLGRRRARRDKRRDKPPVPEIRQKAAKPRGTGSRRQPNA